MLAEYLKEKDGAEVIETEGGFAAWLNVGRQLLITDFFIRPDFRQSKQHFLTLMRALYKEAHRANCTHLTCRVEMTNRARSEVLSTFLKFGFLLTEAAPAFVGLALPLSECESWAADQ